MTEIKPIAESKNFIVLDEYEKIIQPSTYQSEADMERELISDLVAQGYEYAKDINSPEKLLENLKQRLESLNEVKFTPSEWAKLLSEYLDAPNDGVNEKTRKIQDNHIYDFVFDDGHIQNIYLLDKKNIARNSVQVVNQFEQTGAHTNRYDVTILINGLPLVQIELKKRGVAIREAFNQIHRYAKESFNASNSLFKYLQIFVISNGTDTRYFANTTKRDKTSFDFTINWADSKNYPIKDIKDFTATFLAKNTLLSILTKYCVFDASDTLLIMRPYQIAATERILWKINSSH
uniref:type I restriction endonuclease n=1 Tax=uncultured Campylobacter sp. TaxID=218934 RepID=UPI00261FB5B6